MLEICYRKEGVIMRVFRKFGRLMGSRLSSVLRGAGRGEPKRVSPAGRLLPSVAGGGARSKQTEKGFTLQTLIVTAVLVLVAVGAALVLVAINRSSSDDFEEAGNVGLEGKCQTWEIHLATLEAAGHGGPEGHGGVFSSNIGCLAPCYWEITSYGTGGGSGYHHYPGAYFVRNKPSTSAHQHVSKLYYYDDNRPPAKNHIRLGVVNLRVAASASGPFRFSDVDIRPPGASKGPTYTRNTPGIKTDEKFFFRFKRSSTSGVQAFHGRPVTPEVIADGIPTIVEPNWFSYGDNPGGGVLATDYPDTAGDADLARYSWEDEYWEVRADPGREVCEIVNVAHDDLLVCSSAAKDNKCEPATS